MNWPGHVQEVALNQRVTQKAGKGDDSAYRWERLAEIQLKAGDVCRVVVANRDTDGYVIVDAVRLESTGS